MNRFNREIRDAGREGSDQDSAGGLTFGDGIVASVSSQLERGADELRSTAATITTEIGAIAQSFEGLAGYTGTILNLAAAIVECVENKSVTSVLAKVQTLGAAARTFIAERLEATTGILETVTTEVKLLRQLTDVAESQEAIALEIKVLSVLTNVEVARLGAIGVGFQYLARELAEFSKSVMEDTHELASHMEARRAALEDTKRVLLGELPRLREALARIEIDLGNALSAVDASLAQLSTTPAQFRAGVEHIARQIAGVVAAIQRNDITRQQTEHVEQAFELISTRMHEAEESAGSIDQELPQVYAGLLIQACQLQTIKVTVAKWIAQIRECLGGILQVSTSEVVGIGPVVLAQERKVSAQLVRIEKLESEGQAYSERIRGTLGGLANLMQLVDDHLKRSKSIRERLRLLAFNSIVEASHLGTQADVILAISKSIKEVSLSWSTITDQSGQAMREILNLVTHTNQVMAVFSPAGNEELREAGAQTRKGLDNLRSAAEFAARQAANMQGATENMKTKITEIGRHGDRLGACCERRDAVLAEVESLRRQIELDHPEARKGYDVQEIERLFSGSYTTELERDVLRAAVRGLPLPELQETVTGNSVELF